MCEKVQLRITYPSCPLPAPPGFQDCCSSSLMLAKMQCSHCSSCAGGAQDSAKAAGLALGGWLQTSRCQAWSAHDCVPIWPAASPADTLPCRTSCT